jgi:hypothetical protein
MSRQQFAQDVAAAKSRDPNLIINSRDRRLRNA